MVTIDPYGPADAAATLTVYQRAIRETASTDYSPQQIAAWAADDIDVEQWNERRMRPRTLVARSGGEVAGFGDIDGDGYVDMMFVAPEFVGRGVATALLEAVLQLARADGTEEFTVHASVTARPFFERKAFVVVEERHPVVRGVELTNFLMRR
jgi:putative acetyltransferase